MSVSVNIGGSGGGSGSVCGSVPVVFLAYLLQVVVVSHARTYRTLVALL